MECSTCGFQAQQEEVYSDHIINNHPNNESEDPASMREEVCFSKNIGYVPIRHKVAGISMSEISNERQGKIFESRILETLKLLPAFLSGYLVSYSSRYHFMKLDIYLSQLSRNVLKA